VEQVEAGLQIYVEQVGQEQGGLQIDVEQVEQGHGVCPAEPLHLTKSGTTRPWKTPNIETQTNKSFFNKNSTLKQTKASPTPLQPFPLLFLFFIHSFYHFFFLLLPRRDIEVCAGPLCSVLFLI